MLVSILMVADLPTPFGPMKASNSPSSSEKLIGSGNAPLSQACIKERSEGTVEQRCKRYTLIKMNNVIILLLSSCLTDASPSVPSPCNGEGWGKNHPGDGYKGRSVVGRTDRRQAEHLVALRECREREGITIRRIYID